MRSRVKGRSGGVVRGIPRGEIEGRSSEKGRVRGGKPGKRPWGGENDRCKGGDVVRDGVRSRGGDKDKDGGRERVRGNGNDMSEGMDGQE